MRLVRFGPKNQEKPGIEIDGRRLDCSAFFTDWNRSFFLNNGLSRLQSTVENNLDQLPPVSEDVRWGSPVARPGMIMCIGLNYSDHARESGMAIPEEPILFMKATNTISGPYDDVAIPKASNKTDWEVELGVVLGKDVSYLRDQNEAEEAIAGYCIIHDLSERSFQLESGGQWVKGKSCPGFTPAGPYLVTKDELDDVLNLNMKLSVNGVEKQNGNTSTMIFSPAYVVHYISQFMQLEAGDIISTGTPPGVGLGMDPPEYLSAGDSVTLNIQRLGVQRQNMIATKVPQ